MKRMTFFLFVSCVLFLFSQSYAQLSHSPRQTGEEVLIELLMGSDKFVARVGSNGCTDKSDFKVEVKKETGLSATAPHYVLTIVRITPDECKAIVKGGTLVLFDLGKDLGIKGDFSYSITNRVMSPSRFQSADESLWSIFEKYFTVDSSEIKISEIKK